MLLFLLFTPQESPLVYCTVYTARMMVRMGWLFRLVFARIEAINILYDMPVLVPFC